MFFGRKSVMQGFCMLFVAGMYPVYGQDLDLSNFDLMGFLNSLKLEGPTACPSNPEVKGYSNITQLVVDVVLLNIVEPKAATYTICPNMNYTFREELSIYGEKNLPLIVPFDDMIINCGEDGAMENNCMFMGGYVHVVLGANNTQINGFTFMGSKAVSVVAVGASPNEAKFSNCNWKENGGWFLTYSQFVFENLIQAVTQFDLLSSMIPSSIEDLDVAPEATEMGMTLTFDDCEFHENSVEVSLMYNNFTATNINRGHFEGNKAKYADIVLNAGSEGSISGSCFVREGELVFGNVFVSQDSTLVNDNNYGDEASDCEIFMEGEGMDCLTFGEEDIFGPDSTICTDFTCESFTADTCGGDSPVSALSSDSPVSAPLSDSDAPVSAPIMEDISPEDSIALGQAEQEKSAAQSNTFLANFLFFNFIFGWFAAM